MSEFESHGPAALGPKLAYLNEACIKLRKKPLYMPSARIWTRTMNDASAGTYVVQIPAIRHPCYGSDFQSPE